MLPFIGIEFQSANLAWPATGEFLRIVCLDTVVHIRHGLRGTPGVLRNSDFDTYDQAESFVHTQTRAWTTTGGMDTVFSTEACLLDSDVSPTPSPTEIEKIFTDRWDAAIAADFDTPYRTRGLWVLAEGLLSERDCHHGAATLAAYLMDGPHAMDESGNRLVATTHRLPAIRDKGAERRPGTSRFVGPRTRVFPISPLVPGCVHTPIACARCTTRQAQLLEFLTRDQDVENLSWGHLRSMGDASRRLVAAGERG